MGYRSPTKCTGVLDPDVKAASGEAVSFMGRGSRVLASHCCQSGVLFKNGTRLCGEIKMVNMLLNAHSNGTHTYKKGKLMQTIPIDMHVEKDLCIFKKLKLVIIFG